MGFLHNIRNAGFKVELEQDSIAIIPFSKLSGEQIEFLKTHKAEIIDELKAERICRYWLISLSGGQQIEEWHVPGSSLVDMRKYYPDATELKPVEKSSDDGNAPATWAEVEQAIREACQKRGDDPEIINNIVEDCCEDYAPESWRGLMDYFQSLTDRQQTTSEPAPGQVIAWTPAGQPMQVKANDHKYVDFIAQMNPKPEAKS